MAERLEVSQLFIQNGYKTQQVILYADVSNSTWYNHLNKKETDGRQENSGRPTPGYSLSTSGEP